MEVSNMMLIPGFKKGSLLYILLAVLPGDKLICYDRPTCGGM